MKARIIDKPKRTEVPKRVITDEAYAREFWKQLQASAEKQNDELEFTAWWDHIKTVDFAERLYTRWDRANRLNKVTNRNK